MGVHARVRLAGFLTLVGESARPCFVLLSWAGSTHVALSVSRTNTIFFKSSTFSKSCTGRGSKLLWGATPFVSAARPAVPWVAS